MTNEFSIFISESESDFPMDTMEIKTLRSVNGRIELNDLQTLDERLHIVRESLYPNLEIWWEEKTKVSNHAGLTETYYEIKLIPHNHYRDDEYLCFDELERLFKYSAINYELIEVWGTQSMTSVVPEFNRLPYRLTVPKHLTREEPSFAVESKVRERDINDKNIYIKTMDYVKKQIGF